MKTKIRIIALASTLALVGVTSVNAASLNTGRVESSTVIESELMGNIFESVNFEKEALMVNKMLADREEAKAVKKVFGENSPVTTEAEAKVEAAVEANEAFDSILNKNDVEKTDYRKEAQLIAKSIADKEEAKALSKQNDEEKLAENK